MCWGEVLLLLTPNDDEADDDVGDDADDDDDDDDDGDDVDDDGDDDEGDDEGDDAADDDDDDGSGGGGGDDDDDDDGGGGGGGRGLPDFPGMAMGEYSCDGGRGLREYRFSTFQALIRRTNPTVDTGDSRQSLSTVSQFSALSCVITSSNRPSLNMARICTR